MWTFGSTNSTFLTEQEIMKLGLTILYIRVTQYISAMTLSIFFYLYVCLLVYYFLISFIYAIYSRYIGVRGFFKNSMILLFVLLVFCIMFFIYCTRHDCTLSLTCCTLALFNDFFVFFTIMLNVFTTCGVCIVIILTIITLFFWGWIYVAGGFCTWYNADHCCFFSKHFMIYFISQCLPAINILGICWVFFIITDRHVLQSD